MVTICANQVTICAGQRSTMKAAIYKPLPLPLKGRQH